MKKIILLLAIPAFGLSSCSDLLEEHPKAVAAETFYNTETELHAALLSPIQKVRSTFTMNLPTMLESLSDMNYPRGSWEPIDDYATLNATNTNRSDGAWSSFYQSIRDCNIALKQLPNSSLNESKKASFEGQLRFLRAFNYFYIVRLWGKGPLRTEENMDEFNMAISDSNTLYNFIVEDLTYACQNSPEIDEVGLPTKYAALSLLAEVNMYLEKYSEAASSAKQVIDSGKYDLVQVSMSKDFDNVFGPDLGTSSEEIFYEKNDNTVSGNGWMFVMLCAHPGAYPREQKFHKSGGWYGLYTQDGNEMIDEWEIKDLRRDYNLFKYNFGLGDNTYLNCKFIDPNATGANGAGNDYPFIRYADVLLLYAEATMLSSGNPTSESMEALNKVHRRAYGYNPNSTSEVDYALSDYSTKDAFYKILDKEEGYETFNEGKRWFYLVRRGIAADQILKLKGKTVQNTCYAWRIPDSEINYNESITQADQNPGY